MPADRLAQECFEDRLLRSLTPLLTYLVVLYFELILRVLPAAWPPSLPVHLPFSILLTRLAPRCLVLIGSTAVGYFQAEFVAERFVDCGLPKTGSVAVLPALDVLLRASPPL